MIDLCRWEGGGGILLIVLRQGYFEVPNDPLLALISGRGLLGSENQHANCDILLLAGKVRRAEGHGTCVVDMGISDSQRLTIGKFAW